tara:strand:+ start:319 stop:648 length:330 start_codon:yes stop_codon:yes gene_type:complete
MAKVKIDQLIATTEQLLQALKTMKSEQTFKADTSVKTPKMYSIEEFTELTPYASQTSVYNILDKLELGPSWKKDLGVGKPRFFYSQETVDAVLKFIEDQENNRGVLVAI